MQESLAVNAGNLVYAAPEALDPSKGSHSPAMDVCSFAVKSALETPAIVKEAN